MKVIKYKANCWRAFDKMPKWDVYVDIIWADGTEDKLYWSKTNVEQIDFDVDCKPIKWRYTFAAK